MRAGGLGGTARAMRGSSGVGGGDRLRFDNAAGKKALSRGTGWSASRGGRKENGAATGCSPAFWAAAGEREQAAWMTDLATAEKRKLELGRRRARILFFSISFSNPN